MCLLCKAFGSDFGTQYHADAAPAAASSPSGVPSPAYASTVGVGATGNQDADGLLSGVRWSGTVTYSFPDSASDYAANYGYGEPTAAGFGQVSAVQQQAVHATMALVRGYTNLNIQYAGTNDADIRIAQSSAANPTAYAYYPNSTYKEGGDIWFGTTYNYTNPKLGDYYWLTHIHELGHSFGLKHGHQTGGVSNVAVPASHDGLEYTVMTYRSYVGGPTTGYTNETYGYPQSFMMNDILALQTMYGADYNTNGGNTIYSWSPTTGETFIDGVGQGRPGDGSAGASANRIFLTIWDGGGEDTYDFSNYTNGVMVDLNPGSHSISSNAQRAYLGGGQYAKGNVYNAYLFNGDQRSLIENAIGGSGNDTLIGNAAGNRLDGRGGNDTLFGGAGDDVFVYGFGYGNDTVVDFSAGAGTQDRIDLVGFAGISTFMDAISYAAQVGANTVFNFGIGATLTLLNVVLSIMSREDFTFNGVADDGVNEAPTDIVLSNESILENVAGGMIGAVSVSDPDGNAAFSFIVSDSRFEITGSLGSYTLKLKNGVFLDYETETSVTVEVTATDPGGLSVSKVFTIVVVDVAGVTIVGTSSNDTIDATRGPAGQPRPTAEGDTIYGMAGNDVIYGLGGDDFIYGGAGNDTLDGGTGNDTLVGGANDDTYVVDSVNDQVIENANEGIDTVRSWVSYVLPANVENLVLLGTAAIDGTGNELNNTITGNGAANRLDGGAGNDTLIGGAGNDTYVVDSPGDVIKETSSGGIDTVETSISYTLGNYLENLVLTGSGAINGTGNSLNNTITGNDAANILNGGAGNDTLNGGGGNDTLNGGVGNDVYNGGDGDDTFLVTRNEAAFDIFSGGAGTDKILVTGTSALVLSSFNAAASSVEVWQGNGMAVTGDAGANVLDFSGLTAVSGILYVDGLNGNDVITGTNFADTLRGGGGNDRLTGGGGNDVLTGGSGNDTFVYGPAFGHDTITDFRAGLGIEDVIEFDRSIFADFAAVLAASQQVGSDVLITHNSANTILLKNLSLANLNANDFSFI